MSWASRAAANLLPLSREQDDLGKALREWRYTGNYYDLEEPIEDCELCDHPEIRYQFEIANLHTHQSLLVGSECINRFSITAVDKDGRELDVESSKRRVHRDRRRLIDDARKRRVVIALVTLSGVEEQFRIESFIDYLQRRGAFTPKQLAFLFWRLDQREVAYIPSDFKLVIRRDREKAQLVELADWKVRRLWPAMSASQRRYYTERTGVDFG